MKLTSITPEFTDSLDNDERRVGADVVKRALPYSLLQQLYPVLVMPAPRGALLRDTTSTCATDRLSDSISASYPLHSHPRIPSLKMFGSTPEAFRIPKKRTLTPGSGASGIRLRPVVKRAKGPPISSDRCPLVRRRANHTRTRST